MIYITVLNFETSSVDVITVPQLDEIDTTLAEDILKMRGYKETQIQYMISKELDIKML